MGGIVVVSMVAVMAPVGDGEKAAGEARIGVDEAVWVGLLVAGLVAVSVKVDVGVGVDVRLKSVHSRIMPMQNPNRPSTPKIVKMTVKRRFSFSMCSLRANHTLNFRKDEEFYTSLIRHNEPRQGKLRGA